MTAERIVSAARAEIGVKESPANSNCVKYNTAYYGREVSGADYPWCCAFVWWVFHSVGADKLFFGGKKTAYCPAVETYYRKKGSGFQSLRSAIWHFSIFPGRALQATSASSRVLARIRA